MKRLVEVTQRTIIDIDIPDELLTDEAIQEFSRTIFKVSGAEDLIKNAASYAVVYNTSHLEGLGDFTATEQSHDVEVEIL